MTDVLINVSVVLILLNIGFKIGQCAQKRKGKNTTKVNNITPYQIGTTVYFMTQNKIHNAVVTDWEVRSSRGSKIVYTIDKNPAGSTYTTRFFDSEVSDNIEDIKNKIVAK